MARSTLFAGVGLLVFTLAVAAQEARPRLSGLLLTEGSGVPVEGAHVRLVGPDEVTVAEDLSGVRGAFSLLMPPAGVYRLRVARIGYEPRASDILHFGRVADDRWLIREWRIRRPVLLHRGYFAAGLRGRVTPVAYPVEFTAEVLALIPP